MAFPKPGVPDSGDVTGGATSIGDWFATRPQAFYTIMICLVIAFIITTLLKRPFVRGMVVAAVIALVVVIAFF